MEIQRRSSAGCQQHPARWMAAKRSSRHVARAKVSDRPCSAPTTRRRSALIMPPTRGLHSSTFRLNLSAFCGIGIVQGVFARFQGVLTSPGGCSGCVLRQKRLRLS